LPFTGFSDQEKRKNNMPELIIQAVIKCPGK